MANPVDSIPLSAGLSHDESGGNNGLHSVIRFLRTVRMRKSAMIFWIVVCGALGILYFVTATRIYQSRAELFIVDQGTALDKDSPSVSPTRNMQTYQRIAASDEVILGALRNLPKDYRIDLKGHSNPVVAVKRNLSVNVARLTDVLEFTYRSRDPKAAREVLRALIASYREYVDAAYRGASEEDLKTLQSKQADMEFELQRLMDEQLRLIVQSRDWIGSGSGDDGGVSIAEQNVRYLMSALNEAHLSTQKAFIAYNSLAHAVQHGESVLQHLLENSNDVGRQVIEQFFGVGTQNSLQIARATEELLDLHSELRDALRKYGENHPRIIDLKDQIQFKEQFLRNYPETQRQQALKLTSTQVAPQLQQMAGQRLQEAQFTEKRLREQFDVATQYAFSLNAESARIKALDKRMEDLRDFKKILEDKIAALDVNKSGAFVRAEVMTPPRTPTAPISPRMSIVGLLSLMIGVCMGLATVYTLDVIDDRFRSPEELRLQLGVPVLAMIPKMPDIEGDGFAGVHTFAQPNGGESEAFRTLRTAVDFSTEDSQRLVSTSSEPGDGKTTVIANMAVTFAQAGKRTLLIDADMRRPGLSTLLDLRDSVGLSRVLGGSEPIASAIEGHIRQTDVDGLDVLSCGPRPINPSELLASVRFAELLAWVETIYDQILIDAPPVLAVSDPAIIGRLVDGVILVVRPDKDRRRMVIRATESLQSLGCRIAGIVVNHLTSENGGDYSYGYGYGYGYGYAYGHDEPDESDESSPDTPLSLAPPRRRSHRGATDTAPAAPEQKAA